MQRTARSLAIVTSLIVAMSQMFFLPMSAAKAQSTPAEAKPQDKPLKLRTDEIIVDAVVLDKKNQSVTNLTADDFEIYEDGIKQTITSFRFESNAASSETTRTNASSPGVNSGPRSINLISMVFDANTDRDGALRARKAALDYVARGIGPNDYVGVFGIDLNLLALAPYTNDKQTITSAIEAFTSRESKKYLSVANETRLALERLVEPLSDAKKLSFAETLAGVDLDTLPAPTLDTRDPNANAIAAQAIQASIVMSNLKILRIFERYEREFQGYRDVDALLAIINGLKGVKAGRKVMMLFSEGFAISPAVTQRYKSVISAANTTGLTIYAFDIAGLRIVNPNEQVMLERDTATAQRLRNQNPELVSGGVSSIGRTEEVARLNVVSTLDELTEETGGYAIKNTNDISEGLKRILDEIGNHYVMTYQSNNPNYDGKFRRIALKLSRGGDYKIHARRGYYALRTLDDSPVMAHEIPLLERVNAASPINDFPFQLQAFHFRGTDAARLVALYAGFPVSALSFSTDEKTKQFSSKYALLILVKNANNDIVRKVGQEFTLRGPIAQIEEVRKRPQIYNQFTLLSPGQYTLEAVARDSSTGKASVLRKSIEIPTCADDSLRISSLVISRGVNQLTEEQKKQKGNPLFLEGQAYFVPNLEENFSLTRDKNLLLHFDVYVSKESARKVSVSLAFMKDGAAFTQADGALPEADKSGLISYSTAFGLQNFLPGAYDLKITVSDGTNRSISATRFKVEQ